MFEDCVEEMREIFDEQRKGRGYGMGGGSECNSKYKIQILE